MNKKSVFNIIGKIVFTVGLLLLLPALVSLIYGEIKVVFAFAVSAAVAVVFGGLTQIFTDEGKLGERLMFTREGLMTVGLAWLLVGFFGCLPYIISGEIPSFADAFFESVSGFTTTGATILNDVECLSHGVQFWRAFTHWIGGMGVLVFLMALIPTDDDSGRAMYILKAEMPGPIVGKLVPRIRHTALFLYLIYIALTCFEAFMLSLGDMGAFASIVHALSTAGTGGFGILNASVGTYSAYTQWVITAFMLLFSVNFNLYYLALIGKVKEALSSRELWLFFGIVLIATGAITVNISQIYTDIGEAIRVSAFQVSSFISTTGFATANANTWPTFSKCLLVGLMFIGGCAGSTAGGLKVSRVMLMFKSARKNLRETFHPRSVNAVIHEGKTVDVQTINGVGAYFIIYILTLCVTVFLLSFEKFDFEMIFTSAVSCLNNIGPAFSAVIKEPLFSGYSAFGKIVLSLVMLLGRLELYPMFFVLAPSVWAKKNRPQRKETKVT